MDKLERYCLLKHYVIISKTLAKISKQLSHQNPFVLKSKLLCLTIKWSQRWQVFLCGHIFKINFKISSKVVIWHFFVLDPTISNFVSYIPLLVGIPVYLDFLTFPPFMKASLFIMLGFFGFLSWVWLVNFQVHGYFDHFS